MVLQIINQEKLEGIETYIAMYSIVICSIHPSVYVTVCVKTSLVRTTNEFYFEFYF